MSYIHLTGKGGNEERAREKGKKGILLKYKELLSLGSLLNDGEVLGYSRKEACMNS